MPVRAIADGVVRFAHAPTPTNDNPDDPQNYNPFDRSSALRLWRAHDEGEGGGGCRAGGGSQRRHGGRTRPGHPCRSAHRVRAGQRRHWCRCRPKAFTTRAFGCNGPSTWTSTATIEWMWCTTRWSSRTQVISASRSRSSPCPVRALPLATAIRRPRARRWRLRISPRSLPWRPVWPQRRSGSASPGSAASAKVTGRRVPEMQNLPPAVRTARPGSRT